MGEQGEGRLKKEINSVRHHDPLLCPLCPGDRNRLVRGMNERIWMDGIPSATGLADAQSSRYADCSYCGAPLARGMIHLAGLYTELAKDSNTPVKKI